MSETLITHLKDPVLDPFRDEIEEQLMDIFFESSSRKTFADSLEREAFFWKYVGYYLSQTPEFCLVAWDKRVLGYVLGVPYTNNPDLYEIQPHLKMFEPYFEEFPAHLHINCHTEARGLGIGSKLLKEWEKKLQSINITGLHIMTSATSRNRSFYQRLGFTFEVEIKINETPILFMGKRF